MTEDRAFHILFSWSYSRWTTIH